ncbi:MAG TPA: exopolyphosphatase [Methylococcaceae bacterium]|nr:exopolyphosphatase [Methylococcaceae bacterium]
MQYAHAPELVAAIDLGSNSFHMIVASLREGELVIVDRLREMVRLAAGLSPSANLTPEAQQKAIDCLQRFGQRLRDMPPGSVRAVGTNTLRIARNAGQFLLLAEQALGHPIEIISGIEEARLIYQGVAQSLATDGKRRLVMDIGGGSTEYIIGVDKTPMHKESLHMGCVSMSLGHFPDGKITSKRFKRAVIAAQMELEPLEKTFRNGCWEEAVGASGTLRTIEKILVMCGWSKGGVTLEGLNRLVDVMLATGQADKLQLPELSADRKPILPGGLAILYATFKSLGIPHMNVADGALREGLLYDLVGRIYHEDVRARTVAAMANRYHVDQDHAARIRQTLRDFLEQTGSVGGVDRETAAQWLDWAAQLHEIGLDIAHSQYHKHGAYIIENADLPGFSRQDQKLLATLVRSHRRKFSPKLFKELVAPWNVAANPMAILLRLAVLLNRSRQPAPLPTITLSLTGACAQLCFPPGWLEDHPLTAADLEQEAAHLAAAGIALPFS